MARLLVGLTFMGICMLGFTLVCLPLIPWRAQRIRVTNKFGHIVGFACAWLAGARFAPGVRGALEERFPAIYVSNHTSILDIFLGIWLSPLGTCGIGKREVIWYPFFGQLFWLGGHLRLDRKNIHNAKVGMAQVASLVKEHNLGIWVWAEGTRATDGRLQALKKGFVHLALATGLPVVPVVVTGAHRVWKNRTLTMQTGNVGIRVLPAISTQHWTAATMDEHLAEVHAALNAALPLDQQGPPLALGRPSRPTPDAMPASASVANAQPAA